MLEICPSADEAWAWELFEAAPLPAKAARLSGKRVEMILRRNRIRRIKAEEILKIFSVPALKLAPGAAVAASEHALLLLPRLRLQRDIKSDRRASPITSTGWFTMLIASRCVAIRCGRIEGKPAIPECRSTSSGISVRLRRNPHQGSLEVFGSKSALRQPFNSILYSLLYYIYSEKCPPPRGVDGLAGMPSCSACIY